MSDLTHRATRLVVALTVALLVATSSAGPSAASSMDDYSGYEPQTRCASEALPGTQYLMRWLLRQYRGTGSASMLRPCTSGTSEHKDGRALDWSVDAANAADRALVARFLERIFARDRHGNPHALARRMGIMYLIWNDHMYSAYRGFARTDYSHSACGTKRLRDCSKTLRHRDHVHISLSRSGAAAQTSFYRDRNVRSIPVLRSGTRQLDTERTAVVEMEVPVTGRTVRTPFKLTRGRTYRVVADGLYRYGAGHRIADAACRWAPRFDRWRSFESNLRLNGSNPWAKVDCDDDHTRVTTYTPRTTDYLRLRVADEHAGNNNGSLSFFILRDDIRTRSVARRPADSRRAPRAARRPGSPARRLVKETYDVRARARHGKLMHRSLRKNTTYRVVVRGVARTGSRQFDGNCVKYAGRLRAQHTLDLAKPAADHLSLSIQGVPLKLHALGSSAACNGKRHTYVGRFRAIQRGKARIRIWDPYSYADNSGTLRVTLRRR